MSRSDTDNEKKCEIVAGYENRHLRVSLFHILLFYLLYLFCLLCFGWGAWGLMLLNVSTVGFIVILLALFKVVPGKIRPYVLLAGSVLFVYSEGGAAGLVVLAVITALTWAVGLALGRLAGSKKVLAGVSIAVLALILFGWKYVQFAAMPIGLSFYTFQAISYIADLYMGRLAEPERNPFKFALYMMWFPKWMSGPIERAGAFFEQIQVSCEAKRFDLDRFIRCMSYLIWGLFMKLVIADRLGVVVDSVYADMASCGFLTMMLASVLYTIQIYCDFAGYTNSMIGISGLFGIELTQNFRTPYLAQSTTEFWRRWHISLSNFLKDYIYIPLGGNRKGEHRKMINTLVVFIVCGLWHGAGLSFLVWGLLHGLFNICAGLCKKKRLRFAVHGISGQLSTFCLVSFAWIFFRANGIVEAFRFIGGMIPGINGLSPLAGMVVTDKMMLGISTMEWWIALFSVVLLVVMDMHAWMRKSVLPEVIASDWGDVARSVFLVVIAFVVLLFGKYGSGEAIRSFMYMSF